LPLVIQNYLEKPRQQCSMNHPGRQIVGVEPMPPPVSDHGH
jgi:hypothetical protein